MCLDCRVCCNLLANVMDDLGGNLGCTMKWVVMKIAGMEVTSPT